MRVMERRVGSRVMTQSDPAGARANAIPYACRYRTYHRYRYDSSGDRSTSLDLARVLGVTGLDLAAHRLIFAHRVKGVQI